MFNTAIGSTSMAPPPSSSKLLPPAHHCNRTTSANADVPFAITDTNSSITSSLTTK